MTNREIKIGNRRYTKVVCTDEPGAGGACHEYRVLLAEAPGARIVKDFATVHFQNGPIKEAGVNGAHNEDLIAIVIDRLYGFQSGEYACEENEIAVNKLEEALLALNSRTQRRIARGVEGTLQK